MIISSDFHNSFRNLAGELHNLEADGLANRTQDLVSKAKTSDEARGIFENFECKFRALEGGHHHISNKLHSLILGEVLRIEKALKKQAAPERELEAVEYQEPKRKRARTEPAKHMVPCRETAVSKLGLPHSVIVETSFSAQLPDPELLASKRAGVQKELQGTPFICREFAPLVNPNYVRQDQIDAYLQTIPQEFREIKKKLFANIQKITYQELEQALFACTQELNSMLKDNDYALGYAENKSQKWIAELALQFMTKAPKQSFTTYTAPSIAGASQQSHLTKDSDNLVIFDDASYSGTQLCELLIHLVKEIATQPSRPRHIFLIVPFLSRPASEALTKEWISLLHQTPSGTDLHIITSPIKVISFADKYPPHSREREELFSCENELFERNLELYRPSEADSYLSRCGTDTKCLTFMEWKVPDKVSVPRNILMGGPDIKNRFLFLTAFLPPYKATSE